MGSLLIVVDVAGSTRLVEALLAPDGHARRTAVDGAEALRLVRAEPPDLILMDVMMPLVDGFEACRAIKADTATRLLPVVLVTSLDDTASRVRGIEAGADDFVSRPFNPVAGRSGSGRTPSPRSSAAASCTTSAKSASPTPCC